MASRFLSGDWAILFEMAKIRLLALDLDGTLLNSSRRLSEGSIPAMRRAQEAGVIVCMASGRSLATIRPFQQEAGIVGPIVSCNGAYVVDREGKEVVHETLSPEAVSFVLEAAERHGVHVNTYMKEEMHISSMTPFAEEYFRRTGLPPEASLEPPAEGALPTKLLFMDTAEVIEGIHQELLAKLDDSLCVMVRSEADYLEFLPAGVTKGQGLARLASFLGIRQEETAALGDYWNDEQMIEWAGFGGAMGSAPEALKAKAKVVVGTNSQGGAASFIEEVLRQNALA